MTPTISYLLSLLAGYLLGSISASIVLSRAAFHQDVRTAGSGNAGATNAARVFGMGAGIITFFGDFLKTLIAMFIGRALGGDAGMCIAGAAALIGHCFPLYFGFRGGKAVSAGVAVAVMLDWRVLLLAVAVFAAAAYFSRTASVSSMSASVGLAVGALLFCGSLPEKLLGCFTCALVIIMHRSNIRRLIAGTEPKFHAGKRPKK